MKRKLLVLLLLVLLLLALLFSYLFFYPVSIDPVAWTPPENIGFNQQYAANEKLKDAKVLFKDACVGCEDIAPRGNVAYGGSIEGDIVKMDLSTQKSEVIVNTGGRPLGLHLWKDELLIADAHKGLLSLDLTTSKLTTLVTEHDNRPFKLTDDLETDSTGVIYFSDASDKFGVEDNNADIIENRGNGRLLKYDPATKTTTMLLDKLQFANGIAMDHDEQFVLVNQTGRYMVTQYWLSGPKKGQSNVFVENLPGFPDGISRGEDGLFWLTVITPRTPQLDDLSSKPWMKRLVMRLPKSVQPGPERYNCVLAFDKNGKVIHNFQDSDPELAEVTSVQQQGNKIFFGSLHERGFGVYDLK